MSYIISFKNYILIFILGIIFGILFTIFIKYDKYSATIKNEDIEIKYLTPNKPNIKIIDSSIKQKYKDTYYLKSNISIDGIGILTHNQNIKLSHINKSLYIIFGITNCFPVYYDFSPYIGMLYNYKKIQYHINIGYAIISKNIQIGFGFGIQVW